MTPTFVLECFWPGVTATAHDAAVQRAAEAVRTMQAEGRPIRFLGGALMPADEIAFYRFASPAAADVARAGELAMLPYERIVEYVEGPGPDEWRAP